MKYGDTLRQRSIPEWGHFNIDYDYLKDLIRHQTSSGTGKAVSIPGQGGTSEKAFHDIFLEALKAQHDRITRFIRSKSGEIERRLEHIGTSLAQLQLRHASGPTDGRLPARVVERYAKIDADVNRAGEEIRSLSRFQVAQRTGFRKILKKYRRWTKDRDVESVFKHDITASPDSFYQLDLGHLLDQYIDVLGALRTVFNVSSSSDPPSAGTKVSSPSMRISQATQKGRDIDFDLALVLTPLGARGAKATYWIHPDHIVETEVLLLQHMRLHSEPKASTLGSSPVATRRPQTPTVVEKCFDNEDAIGLLVLDHPESFAIKQNASMIGASEETAGTLQVKSAGNARWTSSGDAAVVVDSKPHTGDEFILAQLKRKHIPVFLNTTVPFHPQHGSGLREQGIQAVDQASTSNITAVRDWLNEHQEVKPVAGICSKRTRFVGLHNNSSGGSWATLDRDIFTKSLIETALKDENWLSEARKESTGFPHAVLQVRGEGAKSAGLIQTLDRSHLVERVRGFSLEAHAVWACCKPDAMSPPLWLPLLDKDIRKLPPLVKRQRRKASSASGSVAQISPPETLISTASYSDGFSSPYTPRGESSVTSAPEMVDLPPLQAFRKKRKPYSDYPPPLQAVPQERYWNEYDNPESEDDGYYIYCDPNESVKFPGQEFFEACAAKTRKLFGIREASGEETAGESGESSDDDAFDDESTISAPNGYGTFAGAQGNTSGHRGYFSNIFGMLRDPDREALLRRESERERSSLLSQLQLRQQKVGTMKLRFYSTCLLMATVINLMLGVMTTTSRRKEKGVVDFVVLFGTVFNFLLCSIAIFTMKTRSEVLGWIHQGVVGAFVVLNVLVDVFLLRWVFDC